MKVFKTNKLFFGKWVYKIETSVPGANLIKHWGLRIDTTVVSRLRQGYGRSFSDYDRDQLVKYAEAIKPFVDKDFKTRNEWNTLNYFINDPALYQDLKTVLKDWIVSVNEPASEDDIQTLQSKSSNILCNDLPYSRYKYRLYIKNSMPVHQRSQFCDWLKNYEEKIHYSKSTSEWLKGKSYYSQAPFLYIEDQGLLLMIKMFLGQWLNRTQEFIPRNTQDSVK